MVTVIFDMDGVISDTEPLQAQAEVDIMKDLGLTVDVTTMIHRFSGVAEVDVWRILCEENGIPLPELEELREKKFSILSQLLIGNVREIPGSVSLIRMLKESKVPRGIASSSRAEIIDIVTRELRIRHDFDALTSGTEVRHGKPAPDIFLLAAKKLHSKPQNCIVIEDAATGVRAAKVAGMKCIGFKPEHSTQDLEPADYIVNDMRDIDINLVTSLVRG